jgi:aminopeptidase N
MKYRRCLRALLVIVAATSVACARNFREREKTYHVLHYALDLTIDDRAERVSGSVTMRLCPVKPLTTLEIDAARLDIGEVRLGGDHGVQIATEHTENTLVARLPHPFGPSDTLVLRIAYSAAPNTGLHFVHPDNAYPDLPEQVWSQGEMEQNHYWFPCYDYPNDKATAEMQVTVRSGFVAISNGALLSVTPHPTAGMTTFRWYCARPIPSYLISVVVGDYAQVEDHYRNIPLSYNVYPSRKADALRSFGSTPDMIRFYSEFTGFGYPWPKYAQTVVAQFTYGGMENATAATLTDGTLHSARAHLDTRSEPLVAHELAHQWFGDLVTCRSWAHAWLNEGFATYFQALYDEASLGKDEYRNDLQNHQEQVLAIDVGPQRRAMVSDRYIDPEDVFDGHIYARGSCILNMLRFILGDRTFRDGIKHYLDLYQYQVVGTEDFRRALEDVAGSDLGWFFEEWVYRAGYPEFTVTHRYDSVRAELMLDIEQGQHVDSLTPLYRMPVDIEVTTAGGPLVHRILLEAREHQRISLPCPSAPFNIVVDKGGWILKRLTMEKPVAMWLYQLHHGDAVDRVDALGALRWHLSGDEIQAAVDSVLRSDPFWAVRKNAAEVLGSAPAVSGVRLLAPAFNDQDARVRAAATRSLRNFPSLDALVALGSLFAHDSSYAVQAEALTGLVAIDPEHARDYCDHGLMIDSHGDVVRAAAIAGLGHIATDRAKKELITYTAYGRPVEIRLSAMNALVFGWPDDEEVRLILERLTGDRMHHVRRRAIERLGLIGNQSSVKLLETVVKQEQNPLLRREARQALQRLSWKDPQLRD